MTNISNIFYFQKRRIGVAVAFCGVYAYICKKTVDHPWEVVRLGVAGSIAHVFCECFFHVIDTVNIRSKVMDTSASQQRSNYQFIRKIYQKEGVYGFGRGFSACFYGSIFCGFSYFSIYKGVKLKLYETFGTEISPTLVFAAASIIAESITLLFHFPYDLIKCRL